MNTDELQRIKRKMAMAKDFQAPTRAEALARLCDELIAGLEAAQAELAEAEKRDMWGYKAELDKALFKIADLRAQLAEATKSKHLFHDGQVLLLDCADVVADLRAQLAEAQAEVERLRKVEEEFKLHMPFLATHGFFESIDIDLPEPPK